jgi:HlyD family secretion protein
MHADPKRIVPVLLILVTGLVAWAFYIQQSTSNQNASTYSGTIESTQIHLSTQIGGSVENVFVREGEAVKTGQILVEIFSGARSTLVMATNDKITSPIDGVVLQRLIEPGEIASPGATLITVSNLNELTLTVYVPEDRYGQIYLGQVYPVTVDSFPYETFNGTVAHISDQAEFTPRNVQTTNSRKATVFAIRLDLEPSGGALKPGMPADVHFQITP